VVIRIRHRNEPKKRTVHPPVQRDPAPLPLRMTVLGLAGVVMASVGALVAVHLHPGFGLDRTNPSVGQRHAPAHSVTTTTAPRPRSIAVAADSTVHGPEITALSPSAASAGAQITVVGVDFFASDGSITATIAGAAVPTVCPTEERCIVTVPVGRVGASAAPLVIHTPSGHSNAVTLHYR